MTNQLITKHRPATLDAIVGHSSIVYLLQSKVDTPHDSHCFLFKGSTGMGKTTLAKVMANELGCTEIQEFDAATKSGVDDMRDKVEQVSFPPLSGGPRAIIIDECHGLSQKAWDSLLINLENPASFNYWFFSTTMGSKVPAAIVRRCVDIILDPLPFGYLTDVIWRVCAAEKLKPPTEVVELCAAKAAGSPGIALANLSKTHHCKTAKEAAILLNDVDQESAEGVDLVRILMDSRKGWKEVTAIIKAMDITKIESARYVILNYCAKAALNNPTSKALTILRAFSRPFPKEEGITPLLLAVDEVINTR